MSWYRYLDVREIKVRGVRVSRDHGGNSPPVRSKPRTTIFPITGACPSTYPNHDILLNPGRNSGQEAGGEASILAGTQEGSINPCWNSGGEASILAGTQEGSINPCRNSEGSINPCRNSGREASILAGIGGEESILAGTQEGSINPCRNQEGKHQSLPELRRGSINPCRNSGGKPQSLPESGGKPQSLPELRRRSINPCRNSEGSSILAGTPGRKHHPYLPTPIISLFAAPAGTMGKKLSSRSIRRSIRKDSP